MYFIPTINSTEIYNEKNIVFHFRISNIKQIKKNLKLGNSLDMGNFCKANIDKKKYLKYFFIIVIFVSYLKGI